MASKPSQLPVWATDQTNNTEPSSGQKQTGWLLNQKAVSSYWNWYQHLVYQWIAYLADGDLVGDHSILGDLVVDESLTVGGDVAIDGGLDVGSDVHFGANVYWDGPQTLPVPPSRYFVGDSGHSQGHNVVVLAASTSKIYVPIEIPSGAMIHTVVLRLEKNTSASDEIEMTLIESLDGNDTDLGVATNAEDSVGLTTITITGPYECHAGKTYSVEITPSGAITPATDRIYETRVSWSYPTP